MGFAPPSHVAEEEGDRPLGKCRKVYHGPLLPWVHMAAAAPHNV